MATAATFKEWNGTALVPLTLADVGAPLPSRRNLATNPSGSVDAAGYGKVTGTGGVATLTRDAGAGADGVAGFIRQTWTTASTNGGGINVTPSLMPDTIAAGDVRTVQAMVRVSVARTISFGSYLRMGTTAVSTAAGFKLALAANTWTPVNVTTLPATAAGDNVYMYCYYDGATHAPGAGEIMDLDLVMGEVGSVAGRWFSGNTANTPNYSYAWTGTPGASASTETGSAHPVLAQNLSYCPSFETGIAGTPDGGTSTSVTTGGGATVTSDAAWAESGTKSLKVSTASATGNSTAGYLFALTGAMARMGVAVGKTYTMAATIHQDHVQTGTLDAAARKIAVGANLGAGDNFTWATSPAAPNAPGDTRLSVTFTVPAGVTNMWVRLMNGEGTAAQGGSGGSVWWDSVILVEGTDGTYWDGDTPDTGDYTYEWTGTPHQSTSVRRDARGTALTAIIV